MVPFPFVLARQLANSSPVANAIVGHRNNRGTLDGMRPRRMVTVLRSISAGHTLDLPLLGGLMSPALHVGHRYDGGDAVITRRRLAGRLQTLKSNIARCRPVAHPAAYPTDPGRCCAGWMRCQIYAGIRRFGPDRRATGMPKKMRPTGRLASQ